MRFALHDLSPTQFEDFVVELCFELLGVGVQKFATGPDGGRDAKFVGKAQAFPSQTAPLEGTTIIQAKHTDDPIGKFSDSSFSGDAATSALSKEIQKIKKLRASNHMDNYLLFANRRLAANANEKIEGRLKSETGVPIVHLFGVEQIEMYIKRYPSLAASLSQFEYDLPLGASPEDLAEVITAIARAQANFAWPTTNSVTSLQRIAFKEKNKLNGLSEEYAQYVTRNYLKHFSEVKRFLADPINDLVFLKYRDAVDEFAGKLAAHRGDFATFDKLLEHLLNNLIAKDNDLRSNKRITRTVFYYMYWTCDIGTTNGEDCVAAE